MTASSNNVSTQTIINWTSGLQNALQGVNGLGGVKTSLSQVRQNAQRGVVDVNARPNLIRQIKLIKDANVLSANALENVKKIDAQIRNTLLSPAPFTQKPTQRTVTQQTQSANTEKTNKIVQNSHQQHAQNEKLREKARKEEDDRKLQVGKQLYGNSVAKYEQSQVQPQTSTNSFVPVKRGPNGKIVATDNTPKPSNTHTAEQIEKPKKKKVQFRPSTKQERTEASQATPKPEKKESILSAILSAIARFFSFSWLFG